MRRICLFGTLLSADVGCDPPDWRRKCIVTGSGDPFDHPFRLHRIDLRAKVFSGVVFEICVDFAETAVRQGWNGAETVGRGCLSKRFYVVSLLWS